MRVTKSFLIIFLVFSLGLMSFHLPKNIEKKVDKAIRETFEIDDFALEPIEISEEITLQLSSDISSKNFFKIGADSDLGYAYLGKARGKDDDFDYLVLFDNDLIIIKIKILVYRENYGGEIASKRWLKQFTGKSKEDQLTYENEVIPISGATISARAMTVSINDLLRSVAILNENHVFQ